MADTKVPCLIFSGNAEKEHSIDLSRLNRITFGGDSMVITSSRDDYAQPVELLYSLYHHLEIGEAFPTDILSGISAADSATASSLHFDAASRLLHLNSDGDAAFSAGVFDLGGHLLLTADGLSDGDAVTLEALAPGVYIALASDGITKLTLKFIIN